MLMKAINKGIIHVIICWVCCCLGSALVRVLIFCMTKVETPTSTGRMKVVSGLARSQTRNWLLSGTTWSTPGSQLYSTWESLSKFSGVVGRATNTAWYRPIQMGNWMSIGPRQPTGLTPNSRYRAIVSLERRWRSPAYRFFSSSRRGLRAVVARIWRIWRIVRGIVTKRTNAVKTKMAIPKSLHRSL